MIRQIFHALKTNIPVATVVVSIGLALLGYLATYINARILTRKKDRLELVNMRLNEFYGPLYVASKAGRIAYEALLTKLGRKAVFEAGEEPSQTELEEWFLWMRTVFTPLNEVQEKLIIGKAHLIVEEQMPKCLLEFVTHVVGYKAVLAKWENGDFSEKYSLIDFPPDFDEYVTRSYADLKSQQTRLLASL